MMDFLRSRSLRPHFSKLPVISVVVIVDTVDPREDLIASALESGVDAVLRRPLEESSVIECLGEVLRRQASVEFVYKVKKVPP